MAATLFLRIQEVKPVLYGAHPSWFLFDSWLSTTSLFQTSPSVSCGSSWIPRTTPQPVPASWWTIFSGWKLIGDPCTGEHARQTYFDQSTWSLRKTAPITWCRTTGNLLTCRIPGTASCPLRLERDRSRSLFRSIQSFKSCRSWG